MKLRLATGILLSGLWCVNSANAQAADAALQREVTAVRIGVEGSNAALRQSTWSGLTEVSVKGDVKSSTVLNCRYDGAGKVAKTAVSEAAEEKKRTSATSNKPRVRKRADMQDYIERAISLIQVYVPPKPEQIDALLRNGSASLGQAEDGKPEIRFARYYQAGDLMSFTYDPVSKALLRASIKSTLGSPKDPVTLNAVFETLPDGPTHVASSVLSAPTRKIQVTTKNYTYQKLPN